MSSEDGKRVGYPDIYAEKYKENDNADRIPVLGKNSARPRAEMHMVYASPSRFGFRRKTRNRVLIAVCVLFVVLIIVFVLLRK